MHGPGKPRKEALHQFPRPLNHCPGNKSLQKRNSESEDPSSLVDTILEVLGIQRLGLSWAAEETWLVVLSDHYLAELLLCCQQLQAKLRHSVCGVSEEESRWQCGD